MSKKHFFVVCGLISTFALGYAGGSATHFFIWDSANQKYTYLPWLYPTQSDIAQSLFYESLCFEHKIRKGERQHIDNSTLLLKGGYKIIQKPPADFGDTSMFIADFSKHPLNLIVPEFDIKDWKILRYTSNDMEGTSTPIPSVEILEKPKNVAKLIGIPANGLEYVVSICPCQYSMLTYQTIRIKPTPHGTRIECLAKPLP